MRAAGPYRISVDTGGTFTDVVIADTRGIVAIGKALTTPERIFTGLSAALSIAGESLGIAGEDLLRDASLLIYGTTSATNAVVTGSTAKTAFLTTKGFKDMLVFKEGGKHDPHDFSYDYPAPYIPRRHTFEIDERIDSEGGIVRPLDEKAARRVLKKIKRDGFQAIAVCLLWSITNSAHEDAIGALIERELPGVPYTLSYKLIPIVREYRRASTTAIDASLKPLIEHHLRTLGHDLAAAGFSGELLIGTSSGGVQHLRNVASRPVRMLKSGPAMAPVAGKTYARAEHAGGNAIVCDTGGTTFDVALVRGGELTYTRNTWIGKPKVGHIVALSSVDVRSIGAGGGSVARFDGGILRVGPESAGAYPGPACYGRGGTEPTLTDAALILGYLDPEYFNGGRMHLDARAANRALSRLGARLNMNARDTARAIMRIGSDRMIKAIEEITVGEGIDPKESVIVAGGGAAGLNIVDIARELGCKKIIVPKTGSAMSACGMQFADVVFDETVSCVTSTERFDMKRVNAALRSIDARLDRFSKEVDGAHVRKEFSVEARYRGQVWELSLPLPVRKFRTRRDVALLVEAFHRLHERLYAVRDDGSDVECINWHGRISIGRPHTLPRAAKKARARTRPEQRRVTFPDGTRLSSVYRGDSLSPGGRVAGPAILQEETMTIVLPPGAVARVSPFGHYTISV